MAPLTRQEHGFLSPWLPAGVVVLEASQGRVTVVWGSLKLLQPPVLRGTLWSGPHWAFSGGCHDSWASFPSADGGASYLG